jgi:nitrous oxidase accessory protein
MNKKITLPILFSILFATWLNPALIHGSSKKAPHGYSKSVIANSSTILVPDNYTTIQEAINAADEGDTIFVRAGTYYEHLVMDKPLSLVGENRHNTTIDGNGTKIIIHLKADNINLSGFIIQNGELGILFWYSNNNNCTGNAVSNNSYGIYLYYSGDNVFTGNTVANSSQYGIYLVGSGYNVFTGNTVANSSQYGIYLAGSGRNTFAGNIVSSNNNEGIYLHHSDGNVLSGNIVSNNRDGIHLGDSDGNVLSGNIVSNNRDGIHLYYSRYNVFTGNTVANSSQYGISLSSSSHNEILHNNFINNIEQSSSVNSVNSWDNGAEGNYWSDYTGTDANLDGIGDKPYTIDENRQDSHPLMAIFLQFNIITENQSHEIAAVCNSTISDFQYYYTSRNRTKALSFKVNGTKGKGFCRICVPNALIAPPHTVTVNHSPPLYFKTVYTNETHTWLYFTYDYQEHEVTIVHMSYPEQLVLSQWAILCLAIIIVVLLAISFRYYRMFNKQKKVIQAYERELGSFPVSHPERARTRFIKDVIERKEKIEKFERKYGITIKPANTLEDLIKKLGVEKEGKN